METIDIYGENHSEQHTKVREACRGIVIHNGKILLTYEVNTDQWFIPGGGLEDGESTQECCVRELAEETGCVVKVNKQYLTINEHYDEWLFVSHYYICDYVGDAERTLTEREAEEGLEPRWISLEEAMDIFSKYQDYVADENKMKSGAYYREYKALLSYVGTNDELNLIELTDKKKLGKTYDIYKACMYMPTKEKFENKIESFLNDDSVKIFACLYQAEVKGIIVVSFLEQCRIEIIGIAVDVTARGKGIGSFMIRSLVDEYGLISVFAETDDDAVEFYRKSGFEIKKLSKTYGDESVVRYQCEWVNR